MSTRQNYLKKLESAALSGNLEEVERLTRNESRNTACSYDIIKKVVSAGQTEAAKLIIKRANIDIEFELVDGKSVPENVLLHSALVTGDVKLVNLIIDKRVSIRNVDKDELPPVYKIVHNCSDNVDYSKLLDPFLTVETKIDSANTINGRHQKRLFTILHYAAEIGNDKIIPFLVQRRCQLNVKSKDGLTALHVAVINRHTHVVRVLLEHEVKVSLVNNEQMTPLHIAIKNGDLETFNILLNHIIRSAKSKKQFFLKDANRSLVYTATCTGNAKMVESLASNQAVLSYSPKETGQTALHLAVEKGSLQIIKLLLKYEARLETNDKQGFTVLHVACQKGNHKIVSLILNAKKCRISAKSNKGLTALHLAAKEGHSKVVSLLLEKGANYKQFDNDHKTALSFALENTSNEKTLTLLLKHIRQTDNNENNSVLLSEDHLMIKYLSEAKDDKNGNSALHIAVEKEDKTAIKTLLKHHACFDNLNKKGYTPFDLATVNGSFAAVGVFLKSKSNPKTLFASTGEEGLTPMHFAVEEGNVDMLEMFFKAGVTADLPYVSSAWFDIEDANGLTPLHMAVRKGDKNLVHLMLKNSARIEAPGRADFETALFAAAENGNTEILEILAEASTSRSTKWEKGYLPLCMAAYQGHEKFVKMLLDKGVDPNTNHKKYFTPLHAAAQRGHEKIVRLLLENGAMVNPKRKRGDFISTPLLGALFGKHSRVAQLLLSKGADFNAQILPPRKSKYPDSETNPYILATKKILKHGDYQDSEIGEEGSLIGYRPLHFAVEAGDKTAIKSLLNNGASVNFKTKSGATAIGLAIEKENEAMIKLLLFAGANVLNLHKNKSILDIGILKTNAKIAEIVVKFVSSSHPELEDKKVTPLGIAIENEFEACVERLLQSGASVIVEHNKESLLHIAVRKKNLAIVKLLLKYGIDANCMGRNKKLSLLTAVKHKDSKIVELLLDAGASVKINVALFKAVEKKNATIVEMFLKRGLINPAHAPEDNVFFSYSSSDSNSDSDSDSRFRSDLKYDSPFRRALRKSSPQVVQKFLDYKASTDVVTGKGEYSIFYAVQEINLDVVEFLLEKGVSVKATTSEGENILHFAISKTSFDANLYQMLVDYNVDLNVPNKEGHSPIVRILKMKHYDWKFRNKNNCLVNILLANGVDPNQLDVVERKTMMEHAINNEKFNESEALILNGADVNFLNLKNKTPLQIAVNKALKISQDFEDQRGSFNSQKNGSKDVDNLEFDKYYVGTGGIFPSRVIVRQLVQEIARRQAAKEEVIEENISSVSSSYLRKYYEQCNTEMDLLKETEICTGITYFDILVAKFNGLASYARNIQVKQVLFSETRVLKLYPNYGKILINRIVIGRDRRYLLDSCYQILKDCLRYNFPILIMEHILSFLGNKDLRNFCVAMKI